MERFNSLTVTYRFFSGFWMALVSDTVTVQPFFEKNRCFTCFALTDLGSSKDLQLVCSEVRLLVSWRFDWEVSAWKISRHLETVSTSFLVVSCREKLHETNSVCLHLKIDGWKPIFRGKQTLLVSDVSGSRDKNPTPHVDPSNPPPTGP